MRKEAKKELTNLSLKPNNIFKLIKFLKEDGKDIGGRCMTDYDGITGFCETKNKYKKISWGRS